MTAELQHMFETAVCALQNVYIAAQCLPWRQNSIQNKDKLPLYKNSHHRSEQFSCTHCVEKNALMFITVQVYIFPLNSVCAFFSKWQKTVFLVKKKNDALKHKMIIN